MIPPQADPICWLGLVNDVTSSEWTWSGAGQVEMVEDPRWRSWRRGEPNNRTSDVGGEACAAFSQQRYDPEGQLVGQCSVDPATTDLLSLSSPHPFPLSVESLSAVLRGVQAFFPCMSLVAQGRRVHRLRISPLHPPGLPGCLPPTPPPSQTYQGCGSMNDASLRAPSSARCLPSAVPSTLKLKIHSSGAAVASLEAEPFGPLGP